MGPQPGWGAHPGSSMTCRCLVPSPAPSRKDTPTILLGPAQRPVCWADPELPACLSSRGSRLGARYAGSPAPSRARRVPIKAALQGPTAFTASRNGPCWTPTPAPALPGCPPTPAASAPEFLRQTGTEAPAPGFPGLAASRTEARVTTNRPPRDSEVTNTPGSPRAAPRDSSALRPERGLFPPDVTEAAVALRQRPGPRGGLGPSPAHTRPVR